MGDMHKLLQLLKEIDDQLVGCMRCGICQSVCPIYAETGLETHVARGKIALLEGLAHEVLKDPEAVRERLDTCLLCGSCAANCPSGVKALDIFLKARAFLGGYLGLSPTQKLIFRGMLANPGVFDTVLTMSSRFQGLFTKPVNDMIGSSCATVFSGLLGDRHILPLAKTAFHKMGLPERRAAGASGLTVGVFYGCVTDRIFPRVGQAMCRVLEHHGVGWFMPSSQACCGIPALSSGERPTFEKLVEKNADIFGEERLDALITPCATCTATIKKIWPIMSDGLPAQTRARVKRLVEATMDVNAFLIDRLGLTPPEANPDATPVTVHDPCHLKKSLGVAAQPRAVIRLNPAYRIVEMAAPDACCGSGGSFSLKHYDVSKRIGKKKRDAIAATGAPVVAAGCPACLMQISDMLSQAGDRVAVRHPLELYAESL